jgi:hypothetical protein
MLFYFNKKKRRYMRVPNEVYYALIAVLVGYLVLNRQKIIKSDPKIVKVVVHDTIVSGPIKPTRENIYKYIVACGIKHPDIVYRQALLESGFCSNLYRKANNLFGMRVARSRPTTAKGEYSGFARYDNWMESVQDYALYQAAYMRKARTREQYFNALDDSYCVGHGYSTKLRSLSDEVLRKL